MAGVAPPDPWTPATPLVRLARAVDHRLDQITRGRWWSSRAAVVAMVVGMVLAAPPVGGWGRSDGPLWRYDFANSGPRLFDPDVDPQSAMANLTFRVVPRLIGAALSFDQQWQYYVMQLVFGLLLLWALAEIYEEVLASRVQAALLTIATAGTWAGATAWVETRGLFDVVGIALVALCMRTRRPWLAALFALAASFSDERALIALPIVVCWHALRPGPDGAGRVDTLPDTVRALARRVARPLPLVVILVVPVHLAIRTWLKHRYGIAEGHNRDPEDPLAQLRNYPNGVWGAFEGLWLVIVAGLATLAHRRNWVLLAVVSVVGIPSLLVGMAVIDISRAIAYAWPLAPLAALALGDLPPSAVRRLVWVAAGVCAVWPLVYAAGDQTVDWFYPAPLVLIHLVTGGG